MLKKVLKRAKVIAMNQFSLSLKARRFVKKNCTYYLKIEKKAL